MNRALVVVFLCLSITFQTDECYANQSESDVFQIEGFVEQLNTQDDTTSSSTFLAVALYRATVKTQVPRRKDYETMTFLGERGTLTGHLYAIRKVCDYLCGDTSEECHYQLLYILPKEKDMGKPLVALRGTRQVTDYQPVSAASTALNIPSKQQPTTFEPPIWGEAGVKYRVTWIEGETNRLTLGTKTADGGIYTNTGDQCQATHVQSLNIISCEKGGFSVLLDQESFLLISQPDYNRSLIKVRTRFTLDNQPAFVVQLGLKTTDIFGILTKRGDTWEFKTKRPDYALIC